MHHHSYVFTECGKRLSHRLFPDSQICKKVSFGRTKASAIAENVLGNFTWEKHVQILVSTSKKFSIACDASNKGNRKMFPIAIQYFDIKNGIKSFVLDFYEDPKECSQDIYDNITRKIKQNNLKIENIVAYAADNASVNYGQHNSVFTNLKLENDSIIKANCLCHVLHNTAKHGLVKYPLDVEILIMKIFAHFSLSA
jgi:hypothetical protein